MGKLIPQGFGKLTPKEYEVLIFLGGVAHLTGGVDVKNSFVEIGVNRKAVVLNKPHEGLDLIRNIQFPNPAERVVGTFEGVSLIDHILIETFTREFTIPPKHPEGSVLGKLSTLKERVLDCVGDVWWYVKR